MKQQQFIESIIKHRDQAVEQGLLSADLDDRSTMAMEGRWNELIYRAVVPATLEIEPDDPVARHRMIGKLNRQILLQNPVGYLRWLALTWRRAIWGSAANAMMNPFLLLAFLFVLIKMGLRALSVGKTAPAKESCTLGPSATSALYIVALSYMFVMTTFVVLTSPALGRFIDATVIFMPGFAMVVIVEATGRLYAKATAP